MFSLEGKTVLVIGLGGSGQAAARLCRSRGATVIALDEATSPTLEEAARALREEGVTVQLRAARLPDRSFDLGVLSPGVPPESLLVREAEARRISLISELELGYQHALCLNVAISGTNGKTTTTELVAAILTHAGRRTVAAGNIGLPFCAVVDQTQRPGFADAGGEFVSTGTNPILSPGGGGALEHHSRSPRPLPGDERLYACQSASVHESARV